jgi:hypothetical protein
LRHPADPATEVCKTDCVCCQRRVVLGKK